VKNAEAVVIGSPKLKRMNAKNVRDIIVGGQRKYTKIVPT
jgi:hypothetical protein